MLPQRFRYICERIFGRNWITPVSEEFDVNYRSARRWAVGEVPVPKTAKAVLKLAIEKKRNALNEAEEELENANN